MTTRVPTPLFMGQDEHLKLYQEVKEDPNLFYNLCVRYELLVEENKKLQNILAKLCLKAGVLEDFANELRKHIKELI